MSHDILHTAAKIVDLLRPAYRAQRAALHIGYLK